MFKKFLSLVVAGLFSLSSNYVYALPEGEQVISGSANFERLENTLNITTSDRVIINYNSFSIAEPERVNFYQPSSSSVALNRVVGVNPSEILGVLTATGKLYLINPNGILFGPNSQVDVKGLIASTLDIKDSDFLNGNLVFVKNADKIGASVVNKGKIYAKETALLGSAVRNEGTIVTTLGKTILASGEKMTLGLDTAGMISVVIDEAVKESISGVTDGVKNTGKISSDGGVVVLTAKALDNVFNYAVNNEGIIEANSLEGKEGKVELTAEGNIKQGGRISANAPEGESAGNISIVADGDIVLESGSITEAKATGLVGNGGSVGISGDNVYVNENAKVDVSAGTNEGNAGTVLISALDKLVFNGILEGRAARGYFSGPFVFFNNPKEIQPTLTTDKFDYSPEETPVITATGFQPESLVNLRITNPVGEQEVFTILTDSEGGLSFTYTPDKLFGGVYTVSVTDGVKSAVTSFTDDSIVYVIIGTPSVPVIPAGGYSIDITLPLSIPQNNPPDNYHSIQAFELDLYAPKTGATSGWGSPTFISFTGPINLINWAQKSSSAGTLSSPAILVIATDSDTHALQNGQTGYLKFNTTTPTISGTGSLSSSLVLKAWSNKNQAGSKTGDFETTLNWDVVPAYLRIDYDNEIEVLDKTILYGEDFTVYSNVYYDGPSGPIFLASVDADWSLIDKTGNISTYDADYLTPTYGKSTTFTGYNTGKARIQATAGVGTDVTGTITVSQRPITVTADDKTKTYGDADPAFTYQVTSGSLAFDDEFSGALTRDPGENVGDYAITQGSLTITNIDNYDLTFNNGTLRITKRSIEVTADDKSKVYGDADPAFTYQVTSGSLAFDDEFSGALTRDPGENVGDYAITQGSLTITNIDNYDLTFNNGTLTITKRPITVTADPGQSKTQGQPDPVFTYTYTGTLVGGDSFSGALSRVSGEEPGDYPILLGSLTLGSNYDIDFISALFTILAAVVPPTPTAEALLYDYLTERWRWPVQEIIGTDTGTRVYAMDPQIKPIPVYFYHPVTPTDAGAFEGLALTADMYEFIENNIRARGQEFFPWLEEEFKKKR